jgi:glycosyltransferase involved in cell wall biosynthesis
MGNYETRSNEGRNIKGTPAIRAAVERLQGDGIPVRLVFATGVKNKEVRFLQVQADVIVDQLNYGRYGATAREAMMLGKPAICYINPNELTPATVLSSIREVPLVSATEATVYQVLKDLLLSPEKRQRIGRAGREYALKWHSADACAERYERIYDAIVTVGDRHTR